MLLGAFASQFADDAPEGFEWKGDWILDKVHGCCDAEGWSYDSSFGTVDMKPCWELLMILYIMNRAFVREL
jgi:hypothetical protein